MNKKIISIILLCFVLLSNISFSLINAFSVLLEKDNYLNSTNVIDINSQCSMLVNIPKDFVNMCVKIQSEMQIFTSSVNKIQNIVTDTSSDFNQQLAVTSSILKLNFARNIKEYSFNYLLNNMMVLLKLLIIPLFIFYLLFYIGLLRLFNGLLTNLFLYKRGIKFCLFFK